MDIEFLYQYFPVFAQNIACSLQGWKIKGERYGGKYHDVLKDYEGRTYWPVDKVIDYRNKRLRAFIHHAVKSVPFYQKRFSELGISPGDIQQLDDLKYLPVLSKDEIQNNSAQLLSNLVPRRDQRNIHTSGTTGRGLYFLTTRTAIQEQWAVWWRYRHWHGIHEEIWCAYFGGRVVVSRSQNKPPYWRFNLPGRQIIFSGYHMSPQNLPFYVEALRRKRPPLLHGYPSLLALLASFILDNNIDLGYQIKWVTIGAENLLRQQADLLEKAFGVRPKQHYGMEEAVANISECEQGSLHVDEDFAAVEFIPNHDGRGYKIIGTNFTNLATPLIRYDVEDLVTLSEKCCSCGRPGRIVANIDGRLDDYVILKNSTKNFHLISAGLLDMAFKNIINIREAQIYQNKPGEIIIRIVPGKSYNHDDEETVLYEIRKRIGNYTSITINYMDNLPRSRTGKLRFAISEIEEAKRKKND